LSVSLFKIFDNDGCMVACGIRTHALSSYRNANRKHGLWI